MRSCSAAIPPTLRAGNAHCTRKDTVVLFDQLDGPRMTYRGQGAIIAVPSTQSFTNDGFSEAEPRQKETEEKTKGTQLVKTMFDAVRKVSAKRPKPRKPRDSHRYLSHFNGLWKNTLFGQQRRTKGSLRTVLYSKGLLKKYVFGHTLSEHPRPPRALSSYPTKRQEESPALRAHCCAS